ncbi:helix-turn-helix domain-containing protein [Sphaerisporangium sp. NPDC051011]|uniref:helix-turn-helix domain-containing protein n=1 Tax=Sphaerisporangium sp. NPDC051011 TaxID=3155792 RepID=UPI0033E94685
MTGAPETHEFSPNWALHPGAILRTTLERQGIRQNELAERTGLSPKHINQIVKETVGISGDIAVLLGRVLDVDASFWTRAEADYQAYISAEKAKSQLPEYVSWLKGFDISELHRRGITRPDDSDATAVEKTLRFFRVASPAAFAQTWQRPRVSFRRSQAFEIVEQNTALWLRLVERSAEDFDVKPLKIGALRAVARTIPSLTTLNVVDGFTAARTALAEVGVVLTFVRQVPETRLCGATWWLGADRPVIGLTERQRKPDIFWFSLIHEVAHIILHPKRTTFLELRGETDEAEKEADEFAESILFPGNCREQIQAARTRAQLLLLSAKLGLGPAIVAGQHGHLTNRWNIGGSLRGRITDQDIDAMEKIACVSGRSG